MHAAKQALVTLAYYRGSSPFIDACLYHYSSQLTAWGTYS
jgi:hypothetical protein